MIKKIILWILVLSCMGAIFFFSSQEATESTKTSSLFITGIVKFFDFNNALTDVEVKDIAKDLTWIVRKGAHFSIYAVLSILVSLLLYEYRVNGWRMIVCSTLICFFYACSDEIHQMFVRGRSGQISDVVTDVLGAFCGAVFLMAILHFIKKNRLNRG